MGPINKDSGDLTDLLPDLVLLVRRDGILLNHLGGRSVEWLRPATNCSGRTLSDIWPAKVADLIHRLTRRAICDRTPLQAELRDAGCSYEVHVTPQSPDRAVCVIRPPYNLEERSSSATSDPFHQSPLDRRGFLRRFKHSISLAALSERPLAVGVIHIDGLVDISRVIDTAVSQQVMSAAVRCISAAGLTPPDIEPSVYMGQLAEHLLVLVLETPNRDVIEACVHHILATLRKAIKLGDAEFHLTPYAGVAILGRDTTSPELLLEHARAGANEARRSGHPHVCFFSDTLRLRTLTRLDVTRELRDAVDARAIKLRYVGRHDLATGRLVTLVGYLTWIDPIRGEVRPAEFLTVAEATGLSTGLSRSVLASLEADFAGFRGQIGPEVRISFGALRHHVLSDSFLADIKSLLANGIVTSDRLELRISERTYVSQEVGVWQALAHSGVRLVVDEFGRQVSSLDLLARVPLWGLQLDRSWVTAVDSDDAARRVCAAVINVALGLGLTPIATGIDNEGRRAFLSRLGCLQGLGDLYAPFVPLGASCAETASA